MAAHRTWSSAQGRAGHAFTGGNKGVVVRTPNDRGNVGGNGIIRARTASGRINKAVCSTYLPVAGYVGRVYTNGFLAKRRETGFEHDITRAGLRGVQRARENRTSLTWTRRRRREVNEIESSRGNTKE